MEDIVIKKAYEERAVWQVLNVEVVISSATPISTSVWWLGKFRKICKSQKYKAKARFLDSSDRP